MEGQQVGRYQLLALLGGSGMGVVYKAKDRGVSRLRWLFALAVVVGMAVPVPGLAQSPAGEPIRQTIGFEGVEREYFVRLPRDFESATQHWLLVVVNNPVLDEATYWQAQAIRRAADEGGLQAIVVSPRFRSDAQLAGRFPTLGEGAFLRRVIEAVGEQYQLHEKILLTGYSFGGQLAHPGAEAIPFLVMCGAQDPRFENTQVFVQHLEAAGYAVETGWPDTPHSCMRPDPQGGGPVLDAACQAEFGDEFQKYPNQVVSCFLRTTAEQ